MPLVTVSPPQNFSCLPPFLSIQYPIFEGLLYPVPCPCHRYSYSAGSLCPSQWRSKNCFELILPLNSLLLVIWKLIPTVSSLLKSITPRITSFSCRQHARGTAINDLKLFSGRLTIIFSIVSTFSSLKLSILHYKLYKSVIRKSFELFLTFPR